MIKNPVKIKKTPIKGPYKFYDGPTDPERTYRIRVSCFKCSKYFTFTLEQSAYNAFKRGEFPPATLFPELSKLHRRLLVKHICPKCK